MIIIFKIADNYHNNKSMGKRKKTCDAKQTDSKNHRRNRRKTSDRRRTTTQKSTPSSTVKHQAAQTQSRSCEGLIVQVMHGAPNPQMMAIFNQLMQLYAQGKNEEEEEEEWNENQNNEDDQNNGKNSK